MLSLASRLAPHARTLLALSALALLLAAKPGASADLKPDYHPPAYALKNARIIAAPTLTIDPGTVVIRNGVIESVGPSHKVEIPFDAEILDAKGLTVYPGFIDLYTTLGQPSGINRSQTGPGRSINQADFALASTAVDDRHGLTPEFQVASVLDLSDTLLEERRSLGFTSLLAAPSGAIATGQSALVSLGSVPRREALLLSPVALHISLRPPAEASAEATHPHDDNPSPRPYRRTSVQKYPTSLMGAVAHLRQAMIDADHHHLLSAQPENRPTRPPLDPSLVSLHAARSKTLPVWWEANTQDEIHRALDLAEEFGTTCVILGGREAAKVAPRLKALNVPVVLRIDFPDEPVVPSEADYRKRDPLEREDALKVLEDRASKWKESVSAARDLDKAGVRFAFSTEGLSKSQNIHSQLRKIIAAGLPATAALAALTTRASEIAGLTPRLGTITPGKLGHLVAWSAPFEDPAAKPRYLFVDAQKFDLEKTPSARKKAKAASETPSKPKPDESKTKPPAPKTTDTPKPALKKFVDDATEFDLARKPTTHTGGNVLIKDASILTVSKALGTLPRASILIKNGKIAAIAPDLKAPDQFTIIEADGLVAMPGIIDTHSHMAISGNVNEVSLSIVPEVRVRDVVTGDDPNIFRALAGGATTARLLHGSANVIGGQDAVIKLRYGQPGRALILANAPQGVKFALGENVTRLAGRFPNTRMGVEAAIDRAFHEASDYQTLWTKYESLKDKENPPSPPRRDLRLEALAKVLDGSIKVHCHCYRGDEILMLLNLADRHNIHIKSLQHVLDGYKVASEIAAHGASASTFSDWYAYKIEAKDAIPQNASLLNEAGASVCIKSDSEELGRHLNLEAAKMMKYGVPEADALAMITINPAKELGLDSRIGSLEVGKDADIALFNGHPFNAFTRVEFSLIDGEIAFERTKPGPSNPPRAKHPSALPQFDPKLLARPLSLPEPVPGQPYALLGANIHPVQGPEIPGGTVILLDGKITAVGGPDTPVPSSAQKVDLKGLDLWPGMIDSGSVLGLYEIGSLRETQDSADSAQFQPELLTSSALHAESHLIPVTRANGVLTALTHPTAGLIAGQSCVVKLDGWVPRELVLADKIALHINIPNHIPSPQPKDKSAKPDDDDPDPRQKRKDRLDDLKQQFRNALHYHEVVEKARALKKDAPPFDPRLTALEPYALGQKPVVFHAEHRNEILDALKIAREFKLKPIISGGRDAWKVTDALKEARASVLLAGTLRLPGEPNDPYDAPYANPARLLEAGIPFAIRSKDTGPDLATSPRNLPYEAATAVAFGLPESEALKAVTLTPATLLGLNEKLGSIEVGKDAYLVITLGSILQPATQVKALILDGKPLTPESRQTTLYNRYRDRLNRVKTGQSPLGTTPKTPEKQAGKEPVPASAPASK